MSFTELSTGIGPAELTGVGDASDQAAGYESTDARRAKAPLTFAPETHVMGMRVELSAIKGLTNPALLKTPYRFQVPPTDNFQRQLSYTFNDFDTLSANQHSTPIGAQLEVITFSTLVLDASPVWAVWPNNPGALDDATRDSTFNVLNMTEMLEELVNSGTPFLLRCGQPTLWAGGNRANDKSGDKRKVGGYDVNMPATLRSLTLIQQPGEPDSRYMQVEFHEYRRLTTDAQGLGTTRARSSQTPAVIEVYPDSSAVDRTNGDAKTNGAEGATRLTIATSVGASTLPVKSTADFTNNGTLRVKGYSFTYGYKDSQHFYGVTPADDPTARASARTIPVNAAVEQNWGKGCTLRSLAGRYYGKPNLWRHILTAKGNGQLQRAGANGQTLLGEVVTQLNLKTIKVRVPAPPTGPSTQGSFGTSGK